MRTDQEAIAVDAVRAQSIDYRSFSISLLGASQRSVNLGAGK
jgi:hypothetical protein